MTRPQPLEPALVGGRDLLTQSQGVVFFPGVGWVVGGPLGRVEGQEACPGATEKKQPSGACESIHIGQGNGPTISHPKERPIPNNDTLHLYDDETGELELTFVREADLDVRIIDEMDGEMIWLNESEAKQLHDFLAIHR